jgi:hypothetical protein
MSYQVTGAQRSIDHDACKIVQTFDPGFFDNLSDQVESRSWFIILVLGRSRQIGAKFNSINYLKLSKQSSTKFRVKPALDIVDFNQ